MYIHKLLKNKEKVKHRKVIDTNRCQFRAYSVLIQYETNIKHLYGNTTLIHNFVLTNLRLIQSGSISSEFFTNLELIQAKSISSEFFATNLRLIQPQSLLKFFKLEPGSIFLENLGLDQSFEAWINHLHLFSSSIPLS